MILSETDVEGQSDAKVTESSDLNRNKVSPKKVVSPAKEPVSSLGMSLDLLRNIKRAQQAIAEIDGRKNPKNKLYSECAVCEMVSNLSNYYWKVMVGI